MPTQPTQPKKAINLRTKLVIVRLVAVLVLQATVAQADTAWWLDPIATHINGVPLASSDPQRNSIDADVCDPGRIGCCNGHYNVPVCNSLWNPNFCCTKRLPPASDQSPSQWNSSLAHEIEGVPLPNVDGGRFEKLGSIPFNPIAGGPQAVRLGR